MVTGTDIRKLAADAQLNLSKEEEDTLGKDIEKIIEYSFEKLKEIDTANIEPMEHVYTVPYTNHRD